jgi:hypothetical protein
MVITSKHVVDGIFTDVIRTPGVNRRDVEDIRPVGQGFEFSVRDFGVWANPVDADPDDTDYDWQVPSVQTMKDLDAICGRGQAKNPGLRVQWTTSEKNWITFSVEPK